MTTTQDPPDESQVRTPADDSFAAHMMAGDNPPPPAPAPPEKPQAPPAVEPPKPALETAKPKPDAAAPAPSDKAPEKPAAQEALDVDKDHPTPENPKKKDFEAIKGHFREASSKWGGEKQALSAKIAELEKRASEAAAAPPATPPPATPASLPEDLERIKSLEVRLSELDDRLVAADVKQHPDYKRTEERFAGQTKALLDRAKAMIGEENGKLLDSALQLPPGEYRDTRLEELTGDLPTLGKAKFGAVLERLDEVRREQGEVMEAAVADSTKARERLKADRDGQALRSVQARDAAINSVLARLQKANALFQTKTGEGAGEWNEGVKGREEVIRSFFAGDGALKPEQMVDIVSKGTQLPAVLSGYQATLKAHEADKAAWATEKAGLEKKAGDLQAKIESMTAANPTAGQDAGRAASGRRAKPGEASPGQVDDEFGEMMLKSAQEGFKR